MNICCVGNVASPRRCRDRESRHTQPRSIEIEVLRIRRLIVTLTTVNDACLVLVNTHVIVSPDWALNVAVLPASLEFGAIVSPEQVMSVSAQPAGTVSVAV